jgi:hypothetical protein
MLAMLALRLLAPHTYVFKRALFLERIVDFFVMTHNAFRRQVEIAIKMAFHIVKEIEE